MVKKTGCLLSPATSFILLVEQLFPGPNWHVEAIFRGRQRARPHLVVSAVRVIGQVEIHQETVTRQGVRFEIAPGGIGFFSGESIHKWKEESMLAGVKGQLCFL